MNNEFSTNDWRYFLQHKEGSKYDWSSGKNPPDYNHDYWEQHKEEILAKRREKNGGVRDFGGAGVGYKAKKDGTYGDSLEDYENDDDWSDELTDDELKNIEAHNAQVDKNISDLTKTVEDYINANKGKLSSDQVSKLRADLKTQVSIANEQRINTKNSDDYKYIMDLRKQSGASTFKSSSSSVPKQSTSKATTTKSSAKTTKSTQKLGSAAAKDVSADQQRKEQLSARNTQPVDDFNYDNDEARRRREEQEREKELWRKKNQK